MCIIWTQRGPGGARLEKGGAPGSFFLISFHHVSAVQGLFSPCFGGAAASLPSVAGRVPGSLASRWPSRGVRRGVTLLHPIAFASPLGRVSPRWLSLSSSESPGLLSVLLLPCLMLSFLVLIPEKEKSASGCSIKTTEPGTCRF